MCGGLRPASVSEPDEAPELKIDGRFMVRFVRRKVCRSAMGRTHPAFFGDAAFRTFGDFSKRGPAGRSISCRCEDHLPFQYAGAILQEADLPVEPVETRAEDRRVRRLGRAEPAERPAQVAQRQDHILDQKNLELRPEVVMHCLTPFGPAARVMPHVLTGT